MKSPTKIKVLVVSHSPHFFGAEQSLLCLLKNIDRQRFEPVVTIPERLPETEERLFKELSELGLTSHIVDSPLWIDIADDATLLKALLNELRATRDIVGIIKNEKIDLVYTNTITKISGALAAGLTGVPHVYHVREVLKDHPLRSLISIDATFSLLRSFADAVITNSKAVATQFPGEDRSGIHTVYNAVDPLFLAPPGVAGVLRRELALSAEAKLVGIIGTIHPHKNHEDLLRAFTLVKPKMPQARVVVVGLPVGDYKETMVKLADELNIADRVHFLPFRNDIADAVHDLDLVAVPSLGEPFGRTTIEAMAAGKPVVATNTGASPEIVVDGVTGFIVPLHDHNAMAEAIMEVLSNPARAAEMGKAGKERVQEMFTTPQYVSRVQEVLENVFLAIRDRKEQQSATSLAQKALEEIKPDDLKMVMTRILEKWDLLEEEIIKLLPVRDEHLSKIQHYEQLYRELYKAKYQEAIGIYIRLDREKAANAEKARLLEETETALSFWKRKCEELENSLSWKMTSAPRKIIGLFRK